MMRFVEFINRTGKPIWINPDCVVGVAEHEKGIVGIFGADGENPWLVPGAVPEVLAKLQGATEPAKAADDIVGWWVDGKHVIYVIGLRPDGRIQYLWDGGRATEHEDVTVLKNWTRDPNRKGWEG